ncbi:MAG: M23 family metallopeptidase [Kiritimatiellae bacterium]|nr:M23 family metallopeptidase [Kiritimatiellia bacterium]
MKRRRKRKTEFSIGQAIGVLAGLLVVVGFLVTLAVIGGRRAPAPRRRGGGGAEMAPRAVNQLETLVWPTEADPQPGELDAPSLRLFQPTAAGTVESALYGSTRTGESGGRLYSRFHEGIDIRAQRRDRRGRATDAVRAAAAGTVAYVNRAAGNSSYGLYVVLTHEQPFGTAYTLYAHLAEVAPGIRPGAAVTPGETLGTIGHTSTLGIPEPRSHVHFEIGLIQNQHFRKWHRAHKTAGQADHGICHGWNLTGIDPLDVFRMHAQRGVFDWQRYLATHPVAVHLLIAREYPLDYFRRYPSLWQGAAYDGNGMVLKVSAGAVLLGGRNATAEERARQGRQKACVLRTDEQALGRNGRHLIRRSRGKWTLTSAGERWLSILVQNG